MQEDIKQDFDPTKIDYEKRARQKRNEREKRLKLFMKLKNPENFRVKDAKSIQDTIEIMKISPNGIFQVADNLFSFTFLMGDINYVTKTYEEQVSCFGEWCRIINAFDFHNAKITIFNKNRNMVQFRENILYTHKNDLFDDIRDSYNDIIENKIIVGKKGIEQVKFITITVSRNTFDDANLAYNSISANLIKEFAALGSTLISLNAVERLRIFHDFYRIGDESKFDFDLMDCISNCRDYRNEISCNYINFSENPAYFRTDRKYGKCIAIDPDSYPDDDLSDEFFDNLTNVNYQSVISLDIIPINKTAAKRYLEDKYMAVQSKIQKQQRKRNKNRDYSLDISFPVKKENADIQEMLTDISDNGQQMMWVGICMAILADNLDDLEAASTSVDMVVENAGCYTMELSYRQREALATILPYGCRTIDTLRSMFSRMAGVLIPFKTMEMQMSVNPFYYGVNRESQNVILCNRRRLTNGNGMVFGVTGGGKSMTGSKLEILSVILNSNDDVIILDPMHEYKDTCTALNGQFIEISSEAKNYINPLDCDVKNLVMSNGETIFDDDDDIDDSNDIRKVIASKSRILSGICEHVMENEFRPAHKSIIDRCVKQLFYSIINVPVEERTVPILRDFYELLKKQEDEAAHELVLPLEAYVDGSLNVFNHRTTIDVNSRLTAYGIRDLGEDLESVGMLITLTNISQRIQQNAAKGIATWLYIDEFHVLLNKKYSRQFFIALWKKVRKQGGICTGITQNVTDVIKDNETKMLVSNSEYTMFLKMGPGDAKVILDTFEGRISPAHLKFIENPEPGCGLIRFGNTIIPFDNRIDKTNPIYNVFNTNFYEKAALKRKSMNSV